MTKMKSLVLLYVLSLGLLFPVMNITTSATHLINGGNMIGAIFDCSSRAGKQQRVAMELAIHHINNQQNKNLNLSIKCSPHGPLHAARAARYVMNRRGVKGIVGPNSWEESSAVAEVGQQLDVPIFSLCDSSPVWATSRWPFFVQASPSTSNQMKGVASIIESWEWRRVNVIYEDVGSASLDILIHLHGALHDVDIQFNRLVSLPSLASSNTLHQEMEKLRNDECRVFVVHTSLGLAERIFKKANEMRMMDQQYVWITTNSITSMIHAVNSSVISSMEGVIGILRYFPDVGDDFLNKFTAAFRQIYPDDKYHDPGIFALQAYDATRALGSAINVDVKKMMDMIEETDFVGLSGKIRFDDRRLAPVDQFRIINVIGKSYRELGFWSDGVGFSNAIEGTQVYNSSSMKILGHVLWPGGAWSAPIGWDPKRLRIGVPSESLLDKFIKVEYDIITKQPKFSGFSIDVFEKTVARLKYHLPYDLVPFTGNYTAMVMQVDSKELDAAVGDINIISSRYKYVEFTHAYTESGLCMVVPIERRASGAWLFMKPFTKGLWLLTILINVYNGFVIWSIEKDYCSDKKAPFLTQIATLIWLAFATLFSFKGGRLHSDLSKMATVVWLFVALIITQSYTASLTSMLTIQNIEPKVASLETLKSQNAYVGYNKRSFVKDYLVNVLQFKENSLKNFATAEPIFEAFNNGQIAAAFLEAPDAKLFVAKYCKTFTIATPTYKVGGYGFAFPKGSLLLHDIDEALLSVFESGELKELEDSLMASQKCEDIPSENDTASLSPQGFFIPFIFTGGTSTVALAIYYFRSKLKVADSMPQHKRIWLLISLVLLKWKYQRNRFSRKVSDVQIPTHSPNVSPT